MTTVLIIVGFKGKELVFIRSDVYLYRNMNIFLPLISPCSLTLRDELGLYFMVP